MVINIDDHQLLISFGTVKRTVKTDRCSKDYTSDWQRRQAKWKACSGIHTMESTAWMISVLIKVVRWKIQQSAFWLLIVFINMRRECQLTHLTHQLIECSSQTGEGERSKSITSEREIFQMQNKWLKFGNRRALAGGIVNDAFVWSPNWKHIFVRRRINRTCSSIEELINPSKPFDMLSVEGFQEKHSFKVCFLEHLHTSTAPD